MSALNIYEMKALKAGSGASFQRNGWRYHNGYTSRSSKNKVRHGSLGRNIYCYGTIYSNSLDLQENINLFAYRILNMFILTSLLLDIRLPDSSNVFVNMFFNIRGSITVFKKIKIAIYVLQSGGHVEHYNRTLLMCSKLYMVNNRKIDTRWSSYRPALQTVSQTYPSTYFQNFQCSQDGLVAR